MLRCESQRQRTSHNWNEFVQALYDTTLGYQSRVEVPQKRYAGTRSVKHLKKRRGMDLKARTDTSSK